MKSTGLISTLSMVTIACGLANWQFPAYAQVRVIEAKALPAPTPTAPGEAKADDAKKDDAKKGDDKKEDDVPAKPAVKVDPEVIRLDLNDGSGISGKLSVKDITVETKFGVLRIPITSIKSFTPGLDSYPQLGEQVSGLIEKLGSEDYNERQAAHRDLVKIGLPIRGELQGRAQDDNAERARHIKEILTELEGLADSSDDEGGPAKASAWIHPDTVETSDFTVTGKISPKSFEISSKYGPLTISLADIRRGHRDVGTKEEIRKTLSVEGINLAQRSFKNSNIRVERGDKVSITAEGSIVMTPWGNESVSSPDGDQNFGWYVPQIPGGALVAKIGDSGQVFKVGSKHTFVADRTGVLQFAVGMQAQYARNNYQFPGKYDLKVKVEPK